MVIGHPFPAMNRFKAAEHAAVVLSDTISMCTALLVKQSKSAKYALTTVRAVFRHEKGHAKSIPIISKACVVTLTRSLGKSSFKGYWGLTFLFLLAGRFPES